MGKFRHRIIAAILLVVWCTVVCAGHSGPEHRSMVVDAPQTGELIFLVIYVILGEIGKKLDKGYTCPVYCEVKHKHRIIENDTQGKQIIDKKTGETLDGPVIVAGREQSEGGV